MTREAVLALVIASGTVGCGGDDCCAVVADAAVDSVPDANRTLTEVALIRRRSTATSTCCS